MPKSVPGSSKGSGAVNNPVIVFTVDAHRINHDAIFHMPVYEMRVGKGINWNAREKCRRKLIQGLRPSASFKAESLGSDRDLTASQSGKISLPHVEKALRIGIKQVPHCEARNCLTNIAQLGIEGCHRHAAIAAALCRKLDQPCHALDCLGTAA